MNMPIDELVKKYLELYTLEELLEMNDITQEELLAHLIYEGWVSEDLVIGL